MKENGRLGMDMIDLKPNNKGKSGSGSGRRTMSSADHGFLRHVVWAPVGNGLAFVDYDNNVFVRRSVKGNCLYIYFNLFLATSTAQLATINIVGTP